MAKNTSKKSTVVSGRVRKVAAKRRRPPLGYTIRSLPKMETVSYDMAVLCCDLLWEHFKYQDRLHKIVDEEFLARSRYKDEFLAMDLEDLCAEDDMNSSFGGHAYYDSEKEYQEVSSSYDSDSEDDSMDHGHSVKSEKQTTSEPHSLAEKDIKAEPQSVEKNIKDEIHDSAKDGPSPKELLVAQSKKTLKEAGIAKRSKTRKEVFVPLTNRGYWRTLVDSIDLPVFSSWDPEQLRLPDWCFSDPDYNTGTEIELGPMELFNRPDIFSRLTLSEQRYPLMPHLRRLGSFLSLRTIRWTHELLQLHWDRKLELSPDEFPPMNSKLHIDNNQPLNDAWDRLNTTFYELHQISQYMQKPAFEMEMGVARTLRARKIMKLYIGFRKKQMEILYEIQTMLHQK